MATFTAATGADRERPGAQGSVSGPGQRRCPVAVAPALIAEHVRSVREQAALHPKDAFIPIGAATMGVALLGMGLCREWPAAPTSGRGAQLSHACPRHTITRTTSGISRT